MGKVSKMLCKLIQQQGAPEVDIDTFQGIPWKITIPWRYLSGKKKDRGSKREIYQIN